MKPLVYIWWKVSDDMLIQERVLATQPEATLLAVAELQFKNMILDDVWFS